MRRRAPGFVLGAAALLAEGVSLAAPAQPSGDPGARALVERISAYHGSLPHFEARFEQRYKPRIFGRDRVESGRLTVKQPHRMRWDYETPEPKTFVSDGITTWFHVPEDRQVVVGSFAGGSGPEAGAGNPLDFLTGDRAILDHFDAQLGAGDAAPGYRTVSLTPREPGGEILSLALVVEAASGRIHRIESEDPEGNRTTLRFTGFRSGDPPPDSLFRFTIPPGTEVVTASELRE